MPHGIIIKGIGGFYYVKAENRTVECRARGKFRNEKITPLVGDYVDILEKGNGCMIDKILPRRNVLIRPPVANVDMAVYVIACRSPEPNFSLLDRFLLSAVSQSLDIVLCVNKIDLENIEYVEKLTAPYKNTGIKIIFTSTKSGQGIDELKEQLRNRITVFAGPSGVGKSSLLNCLQPSLKLKTGIISEKLERGRHTTRHCELMELQWGGYVLDTPGFSSMDIDTIEKEQLELLFPEFNEYSGDCKFAGCSHISEPGCAVKEAVEKNEIHPLRYESYVKLYDEISKRRRNYK